MKKKIILKWESSSYKETIKKEDAYFYAIAEDEELIYIGIAEYQHHRNEIYANIKSFGYNTDNLKVWLGYIEKSDYQRISPELRHEIEAYLIYNWQPRDNEQHKKVINYREDLHIINFGCPHFPVSSYQRKIYSDKEWDLDKIINDIKQNFPRAKVKQHLDTESDIKKITAEYGRVRVQINFNKEKEEIDDLGGIAYNDYASLSIPLTPDEVSFLDGVQARVASYYL